MSNDSIITKYRPEEFVDVVGHEDVLAALQRHLSGKTVSHAYLMTGAAGLGKTSIARIIARALDAEVTEIDAATYNSVDAMRQLVEVSAHVGMKGNGRRMYILNEVQRLSRGAFDVLLMTLEEPPPHLFFALTTTERDKIPEAVLTRCYHVQLKPLPTKDIETLLDAVCGAEQWEISGDVMDAVIASADGSPRKALSMLQSVVGVESREEVRRIIALQDAGEPVKELCQLLAKGNRSWSQVQKLLQRIDSDADYDAALIGMGRYFTTIMVRDKAGKDAERAWLMLEMLVTPVSTFDRKAAFYAAIGRIMWAQPAE